MKNREKYKNELMDVIKMDGHICGFVKNHGVPQMLGKDLKSLCGIDGIDCVACGTALQLWLDEEYEEPEVDWNKVEVDTPILVRDNENTEWLKRYFAKYENGVVYAWDFGRTSWNETTMIRWDYIKLAESEEK